MRLQCSGNKNGLGASPRRQARAGTRLGARRGRIRGVWAAHAHRWCSFASGVAEDMPGTLQKWILTAFDDLLIHGSLNRTVARETRRNRPLAEGRTSEGMEMTCDLLTQVRDETPANIGKRNDARESCR
jgi:hypothetical protein